LTQLNRFIVKVYIKILNNASHVHLFVRVRANVGDGVLSQQDRVTNQSTGNRAEKINRGVQSEPPDARSVLLRGQQDLMRLLEYVYETPSDVPLGHHANLSQIARVVHIHDLETTAHPTRQKLPRHRLI